MRTKNKQPTFYSLIIIYKILRLLVKRILTEQRLLMYEIQTKSPNMAIFLNLLLEAVQKCQILELQPLKNALSQSIMRRKCRS
jgi:hypothetical protein